MPGMYVETTKGKGANIYFLKGSAPISDLERIWICRQAIEMLYDLGKRKKIKREKFEGTIYDRQRMETLGGLTGRRVEAIIELQGHKKSISLDFLIDSEELERLRSSDC